MSKPTPMNIDETADLVVAALAIVQAGPEVAKDGISIRDIPKIVKLWPRINEAIKGAAKIPKELADLDGAEADALCELIQQEFGGQLGSAAAQLLLDKVLRAIAAALDLLAEVRGVNPPKAVAVE